MTSTSATASSNSTVAEADEVLPMDPGDPGYAMSFRVDQSDTSEARSFFDEHGYIVFRDVLEPMDTAEARSAMWEFIEGGNPGFDREEPGTWEKWRPWAYGMPSRDPMFQPEVLRIRQNKNLYKVFSNLLECKDLLVSHDRWMLYLPTKRIKEDDQTVKRRRVGTSKLRVHLDMDPIGYSEGDPTIFEQLNRLTYVDTVDFVRENNLIVKGMGLCVQGMVNLEDNLAEDGGTVLVPGFASQFDDYVKTLSSTNDGSVGAGAVREKFHKMNESWGAGARRVPMRAGSVLIWDQRTAHGASPNSSSRPRFGLPVRFFPVRMVTAGRLRMRGSALTKQLELHGFLEQINNHGLSVFGLEDVHESGQSSRSAKL